MSARVRCCVVLALALACAACESCPPAWASHPPERADALYASGACGKVFVDAAARDVALTRAARRIADLLGLDVERRLSVVSADGRLFVEALLPSGPTHALDGLELVDEAVCDDTTFVLVRLPRG
jgi:hypothetical protein